MIRWLNRITTALILAVILAGPPAAVGWWLLHRRWRAPTGAGIRTWLADPPPQASVITLVVTAATVLWLVVAAVFLRIATRRVARVMRRLRQMPLPTPRQATATSLAGTALLGLPTLTATPGIPHPGPPATAGQLHIDPPGTTHTNPRVDTAQPDGVELPDGGWIPRHTAENVAAIAGLFWLRRRQDYHPTPTPHHDNPPQLPAAAALITDSPHLSPDAATGVDQDVIAADELPAGNVTLTGPGAHGAARGLLVTALMTHTAISAPRTHVVITGDDLHLLLGPTRTLPQVPGLHVTNTPALAVDRLLTTKADTGSDPTQPARPGVLYLLSRPPLPYPVPPGAADAALTVVAFSATTTGGDVWQVHTDGTLTPAHDRRRRLCTLGPQTARDLLQFISQAHGLVPANPTPENPPDQQHEQPANVLNTALTGAAAPPARLSVLGDCRLTIHGHTVPIRRSAAWQILVLLAVRPGGATGHQIIQTVWPGLPPASITNRLYTTLSDLRTQLRPALETPLIVHHRDRYLLDPAVVDVDLWHWQQAAHAASQAVTTTRRREAHRDLIKHRGELASEYHWPWLAPPRETVRDRLIDAYVDLVDELPAAAAIEVLREALAVDPYNEDVHRRTITALIDLGDHSAAARLYETYTQRLRAAGLRPSTELAQLADQITTTSPTETNTSRHRP